MGSRSRRPQLGRDASRRLQPVRILPKLCPEFELAMTKLPPSRFFPPAELADADGLLALGGKLTPEWLLDAYQHGIFPWPFDEDTPVAWWSPDPRAIIELDGLHVSRRLRRTLRSGKFQVTCDQDFAGVIRGCATASGRLGRTAASPAGRAG